MYWWEDIPNSARDKVIKERHVRLEKMDMSCGLREFAGFQGVTVENMAKHIGLTLWDEAQEDASCDCSCDCTGCARCEEKDNAPPCAFVVWSDLAAAASPGARLATHLNGKYRGTVTATPAVVNPNTGNTIKVWSFKVTPAFMKWAAKQ